MELNKYCKSCGHKCHCEKTVCSKPIEGFAENQLTECKCKNCACAIKTDWG